MQGGVSLLPQNLEGGLLRLTDHVGFGEITTVRRWMYLCEVSLHIVLLISDLSALSSSNGLRDYGP
jgi:hypothetical protein